jgi:hypothetical protein
MRSTFAVLTLALAGLLSVGPVKADRPVQKRSRADYVLTGLVTAVYSHDTKGYRQFIVEVRVEKVQKGAGLKKGDLFRAFCYQRKEGVNGLEFDTAGHKTVPTEGQRVTIYVNHARGLNEGVYPDWVDVLPKR